VSVTPEKRFLGFEAVKYTDRALLGLAEDEALKSGQVEAALEQRLDVIARHPLGKSAEATRLVAKLELAADRLQAEIALTGRGPLHPKAARRAAARIAAGGAVSVGGAQGSADAPVARRPVVAPTAISKPGLGLTADDLTDFDRVALAVLVVSGGWNASSAKRLATIAGEYGVSVDDLEKVVLGLTQFLSEGAGLQGAMGDVGESATATWMSGPRLTRADAAEGAVERVFTRINDVLRDEVGGGTAASRMRLTVIFALFALSWIGALGYLFFGGGKADDVPTQLPAAPTVADATPAPAARGDVDANGKPVGPIDALAAPAKFPRPPGFVPTPTPAVVAESASAAPSWVADLEEAARALAAAKGRMDGASDADRARSLFVGALSRAADAWPAAGGYRGDLLRALGGVVRAAQGADSLRKLMTAVPGGESDVPPPGMPQWQRDWRHAFGAGCLAVVAVDPAFAPEVAAAAREEMRQRNLPIPRGSAADPFGAAATAALAAGMPHRLRHERRRGRGALERGGARGGVGTEAADRRAGRRDRRGAARARCARQARSGRRRARILHPFARLHRPRRGGRRRAQRAFGVDPRQEHPALAHLGLHQPARCRPRHRVVRPRPRARHERERHRAHGARGARRSRVPACVDDGRRRGGARR
jgi:hypothetical protein